MHTIFPICQRLCRENVPTPELQLRLSKARGRTTKYENTMIIRAHIPPREPTSKRAPMTKIISEAHSDAKRIRRFINRDKENFLQISGIPTQSREGNILRGLLEYQSKWCVRCHLMKCWKKKNNSHKSI